jgi:Flp pilus assembly protein protease CpaA
MRGTSGNWVAIFKLEMLVIFGYFASVYDIKEKRIPNLLVLLMIGAWVVSTVPHLFYDTSAAIESTLEAIIGFATAGILFLLVYIISRNGLGGGDVKLMAAAGLYLGFRNVLPAMLYGALLAGASGLILIVAKKMSLKDSMPLAPFLYIGMMLTIFFL